jgi:hypothetical protein
MFSETGFSDFGPYGGMFAYHPALSILLGSWLSLFKPWISYSIFVSTSIIILIYCGFLIAKQTSDKLLKRFSYFSLLCTFPTYLMLWNAQVHVFTVLAISLILVSLLEIAAHKEKYRKKAIHVKLLIGLLASLLTKPIVFLFFPVLFLAKETRRTLIICLLIYTLLTSIFIIIPFLNPESDNIKHWTFLVHHSKVGYSDDTNSFNSVTAADNFEFFSLPTFIENLYDKEVSSSIFKIPILITLALSALIFFIKDRKSRIIISLIIIILAIYSFYLSYGRIWEYFYATLLPVIPIMIILYKKLISKNLKKILKYCLILNGFFFFPTLFFLFRDNPSHYLVWGRLIRVVPTFLGFISLLFLIIMMSIKILIKKENVISSYQ